MNEQHLNERFDNLFDELENKNFQILTKQYLKWTFDGKMLNFLLKKHKERENFVLPEDIVELELFPSSMDVNWVIKNDNGNIVGLFRLLNLYESLEVNTGRIKGYSSVFRERNVSEETQKLFEDARYIDYIETFGYTSIMKNNGNYQFNELWFMIEDTLEFTRLDITLKEYFDMLILIKGAVGWQYLFFNEEKQKSYYDSFAIENICRWIIVLPREFPNHNYAPIIGAFKRLAMIHPNDQHIVSTLPNLPH